MSTANVAVAHTTTCPDPGIANSDVTCSEGSLPSNVPDPSTVAVTWVLCPAARIVPDPPICTSTRVDSTPSTRTVPEPARRTIRLLAGQSLASIAPEPLRRSSESRSQDTRYVRPSDGSRSLPLLIPITRRLSATSVSTSAKRLSSVRTSNPAGASGSMTRCPSPSSSTRSKAVTERRSVTTCPEPWTVCDGRPAHPATANGTTAIDHTTIPTQRPML